MLVTIKYFASVREAIGRAEEARETQSSTLSELRDELISAGPPYDCLGRSRVVRIALNHVMRDEGARLAAGCEVAFFPPVTGG